ncbi:MAG: DUF255 domain-containing protein [Planctomycetota bacterium]
MSFSPVLSAVLAAAVAAGAFAQDAQVVEASFKLAAAKAPISPVSRSVSLSATVPAGVTLPANLHNAVCGTFKIGKKDVAVAVGGTDASKDAIDQLCIDLNLNGKFDDGECIAMEVTTQTRGASSMSQSKPLDIEVNPGTTPIAAKAVFMKMGDRTQVSVSFPGYLEASFKLGDAERKIAIVDDDLDGTPGSAGDLWTIAGADGRPKQAYAMMAMDEHCFEDGMLVGIKLKGNKVEVSEKKADGPLAKDEAGQRERAEKIWTERFDAEREGFVKARELDTTRKIASKPIDWHYVSFAEAQELAKKANKPMFVDVMAFWCVWCYRMDYYTYPDAEVAQYMNEHFVPVKIIQEQARAGEYDMLMKEKLEAKGIPAMGVFDADGNVLHKIGGWKAPVDFMKDLEAGAAAAKK